jgi:hypothetical protein
MIGAPADVRRVATIRLGGLTISTCGKQYSEWEHNLIAEGYMSKTERGERVAGLLGLDPARFEVWASIADPTSGNKEMRK